VGWRQERKKKEPDKVKGLNQNKKCQTEISAIHGLRVTEGTVHKGAQKITLSEKDPRTRLWEINQ